MNLNNIVMEVSAVRAKQYPSKKLPEFAFAGRSNVGKSSLINKLLNRKSMARVSSKPGKTATINFYNLDEVIYFVDLPGYGYASRSKSEVATWTEMIETYLNTRKELVQTFLLVDSRHKPTKDDVTMLKWIKAVQGPAVVIATKLDKLKKSEVDANLGLIYETLHLTEADMLIPFSINNNEDRENMWEVINQFRGVDAQAGE